MPFSQRNVFLAVHFKYPLKILIKLLELMTNKRKLFYIRIPSNFKPPPWPCISVHDVKRAPFPTAKNSHMCKPS